MSWLAFNERVFEEAANRAYPLLERVRFLAISADILDEFTMVRVAGLQGQVQAGVRTLSPDGRSPAEQLELVNQGLASLLERQQRRWKELRAALGSEDIGVLDPADLTAKERHWLDRHFMARLFPLLTPIAVDPPNPFPFIANRGISMIVDLWRPSDDRHIHGLVPITGPIDRFLRLPGPRQRYLPIEQVVAMFFDRLFPGFEVAGHGVFRVIRDSDLEIEEEAEDLVRLFEFGDQAAPPRSGRAAYDRRRHVGRAQGLPRASAHGRAGERVPAQGADRPGRYHEPGRQRPARSPLLAVHGRAFRSACATSAATASPRSGARTSSSITPTRASTSSCSSCARRPRTTP